MVFNVGLAFAVASGVLCIFKFQIWRSNRKTKLRELFGQFAGEGELDKAAVSRIVLKVSPAATPEEIDTLFVLADADGSGAVDADEFIAAASSAGGGSLDLVALTMKHARAKIRDASEEDAKLAQKLGQLQPFLAVFPQERTSQVASFGPA